MSPSGVKRATYVRAACASAPAGAQPQTAVAMVFQNGGHWCVNAICATPQTWAGQKAVEPRRIA